MLKIHTEQGRFFTGLGDTVCLAWVWAGAKEAGEPIELYASGKRKQMLEFLGVDVCDDPTGAIIAAEAYQLELNDNGKRPRLDYLREYLNIKTALARPKHRISERSMAWAAGQHRAMGGKIITLFPQTHWVTRQWPVCYWVDLSHKIRDLGFNSVVMVEGDPPEFKGCAWRYYNYSLEDVAAMMLHSWLVIGNDSMPVHLSSTLGVQTLALMGPTKGSCVFGHTLDKVTSMTSDKIPCVSCHFRGMRPACDQGCGSLYSLFPHEVADKVKQITDLLKAK